MGLDVIELLLDLEEHFRVTIPDARATRIFTVGDLYVYLLAQTRRGRKAPCPTGQAFYRLRRTLTGEFGVDRSRVRPSAPLRSLFAAEVRPTAWPRLVAALGLPNPPDPDPPRRGPTARAFRIALAAATAGAWGVALLIAMLPGEPAPLAFGLLMVGLLIWPLSLLLVCVLFGAFWLEGHCFRPVPKVRELVAYLAARHCDPQTHEGTGDPTAATVWADLVGILSRHTGVPADQIRPEHRWYELFSMEAGR
jgi:hypothetical protein